MLSDFKNHALTPWAGLLPCDSVFTLFLEKRVLVCTHVDTHGLKIKRRGHLGGSVG